LRRKKNRAVPASAQVVISTNELTYQTGPVEPSRNERGEAKLGLTAELGAFLAGMRGCACPAPALRSIRTGFTDCVAVLIAGQNEPAVRIAATCIGAETPPDGRLVGHLGASAPQAALVYGTAAHALDYDDTGLAGHPSAVLAPAILAEAAEVGADGAMMVRAYLGGYEVWADLIRRDDDSHHHKGWHPSAVFGTLAAASASAVLRGLDADAAARSLGIAASLAGGVVANFGTMTKPFQVGRAAQSGLLAARLAERGLTAAPDALEHDLGFLRALSPKGAVNTQSHPLAGREWRMLQSGINVKLYPMCYASHRVIDAMLDIVRNEDLQSADIEAVEVHMGQTQAAMLRNHRPQSALDAKFSVEFAVAAAAVARRCGLREVSDSFVRESKVQALFPKVQVTPVRETDPEEPAHSPFDRLRVRLRDGRDILGDPVRHPRGHFKRPVGPDALWEKFSDCVAERLDQKAARGLFDRLQRVDAVKSVSELMAS
jgi:2-methylcitrate dehydratase PrpD